MSKLPKNKKLLQLDNDYKSFLSGIKERLQCSQIRAARSVNKELIRFYWELGVEILEIQQAHKWGDNLLEQLSNDMRIAFPGMQGFSKRNLEHMRRFAKLYPELDFAKQAVSQLPWGHIVRL